MDERYIGEACAAVQRYMDEHPEVVNVIRFREALADLENVVDGMGWVDGDPA